MKRLKVARSFEGDLRNIAKPFVSEVEQWMRDSGFKGGSLWKVVTDITTSSYSDLPVAENAVNQVTSRFRSMLGKAQREGVEIPDAVEDAWNTFLANFNKFLETNCKFLTASDERDNDDAVSEAFTATKKFYESQPYKDVSFVKKVTLEPKLHKVVIELQLVKKESDLKPLMESLEKEVGISFKLIKGSRLEGHVTEGMTYTALLYHSDKIFGN